MRLDDLRRIVRESEPEDWHDLGGGPTFLNEFCEGSVGEEWRLFHDEYQGRAVLKENIDVGLAWGLPWRKHFSEPWTQPFADTSASGYHADVLWRGQPVLRERYVAVDGGRYALPLPAVTLEEVLPGKQVQMPYSITEWQYRLLRIVHGLSASHDYDSGLRRAGIELVG